jgi:hypothetical protein
MNAYTVTSDVIADRAARLAGQRSLALIVGLDRPVDDSPTGNQRLNLSLALSQRLLDTPSRQVALAASQALGDLLAGSGPLLVDHIELLFDPLLQIDPLRALKLASRRRRLLVVWPGRLDDGGALVYAEPGHPEYRSYGPADLADVAILDAAALRQVE